MNHRTRLVNAICLAVVLLPGCAPAPEPTPVEGPGPEADLAAIRQLETDFTAAVSRGDRGAMAKMIVTDFIAMPPDRPPIVGSEATLAYWSELFEQYTLDVSPSVGEVIAADQWAFIRATNQWKATPKAEGEPQEGQATYLHIFQR